MGDNREMASSFSFTADLFGTKQSPPSSSAGIFASILSPPSTVMGWNSSNSEVIGSWQKQPSGNQAWNTKQGTPALHTESARCNIPNNGKSSIFQEERAEPCHLSSSLYYGGKTSIPICQALIPLHHPLYLRKMGEKMTLMETIHMVLLEEIGGKVHFIISNFRHMNSPPTLRNS